MSEIIKYEHHGTLVFADTKNVTTHRENCLCWKCDKLYIKPKCKIAEELYKFCKKYKMTTPVYECPNFKDRN